MSLVPKYMLHGTDVITLLQASGSIVFQISGNRSVFTPTMVHVLICRICGIRPCPHDTFPNRSRSIANGSRPVTGETGTLIPASRDHLATRNERARTVHDQSCPVDARQGASARTPNQPLLSHASSTYFFRDMCNCDTGHLRIWHPQIEIQKWCCILPQIIGSWKIP